MIALRSSPFAKLAVDPAFPPTAGCPPPITLPERIGRLHAVIVNPSSEIKKIKNAKCALLAILANPQGRPSITIPAMELPSLPADSRTMGAGKQPQRYLARQTND